MNPAATVNAPNPATLFANPAPAARNSTPVAPEAAFKQVLSREIAERKPDNVNGNPTTKAANQGTNNATSNGTTNATNRASKAPAKEAAPAKQAEQSGNATKSAGTQSDQAAEGASKTQDQQDSASDPAAADAANTDAAANAAAGMLALVANAVQVNAALDPATAALAAGVADASAGDGKSRRGLAGDAAAVLSGEQAFANLKTGGAKPDAATDFAARLADASGKGQAQTAAVDAPELQAAPPLAALAASNSPDGQTSPFNAALTAQQNLNAVQAANAQADKLTPRVGSSAWDQAVGQKVVWMVAGAQQSATLTLNPPDLGPLQIVLNVSNSQANATFIAAQPEVRQALEAAMPKLREMLGDAGIQLGQASVNAGTPDQGNAFSQQSRSGSRQPAGVDSAQEAVAPTVTRSISSGQGMVDTFA